MESRHCGRSELVTPLSLFRRDRLGARYDRGWRQYLSLDQTQRLVTELASLTALHADAPRPHPAVCRAPAAAEQSPLLSFRHNVFSLTGRDVVSVPGGADYYGSTTPVLAVIQSTLAALSAMLVYWALCPGQTLQKSSVAIVGLNNPVPRPDRGPQRPSVPRCRRLNRPGHRPASWRKPLRRQAFRPPGGETGRLGRCQYPRRRSRRPLGRKRRHWDTTPLT